MASRFGRQLNDAKEVIRQKEGGERISCRDEQTLIQFRVGYNQLLNKDPERTSVAEKVGEMVQVSHITQPEGYHLVETYPRVTVTEVISGSGTIAPHFGRQFTFISEEQARAYVRSQRARGFTGEIEIFREESEKSVEVLSAE